MTDLDAVVIDPQAHARLEEWGGAGLVTQMIRLFLENAPTRLDQVRKGLSEGGLAEAERGVHSLKSSAANVGAVVVSNCVRTQALKRGWGPRIRRLEP